MKKFLKISSFIIVFVLLYFYAGMVFMPKDLNDMGGEKYYGAVSYKYEPKNTLDVMFYGNSDVYSGISSMEIYKQTGIASYGCGAAQQTMNSIYKQLKTTLKTQKPKVVVLDTDCFYQPNPKLKGTETYDYAFLVAPFMYHTRWKELRFNDFVTLPTMKGKENYLKGYTYSNKVYDYTLKDGYMQDPTAKPAKIEKSILRDFDKIYKLCKEHNIKLSLITIPTPITWNNAKSNGIKALADKYNQIAPEFEVKFYDMNLELEGFDYSRHFRDNGNHCNFEGAKVVSTAVGEFLKTNYAELTDQSTNAKWQELLKKYENYIENQNGKIVP